MNSSVENSERAFWTGPMVSEKTRMSLEPFVNVITKAAHSECQSRKGLNS